MPAPLIEMRGISKSFGAVMANEAVDLSVAPGEILGLLGENGAGK
ncbi:MAG: sugar ABC transporter ATP-binding protein, partial [Mesorhizobium sp.]